MIDVGTSLSNWIPQVQGRYINEDGAYGAQCWDLVAKWSQYLGLPIINTRGAGRWRGWAGNMVEAFPQTPEIAAAYELLSPDNIVIAGDLLVWDDSYKLWFPATHTAVGIEDKLNGWLLCASQNSTAAQGDNPYPDWSTGPTTIQFLPKRGLLGIIRPRTAVQLAGSITAPSTPEEQDTKMLLIAKSIHDDKVWIGDGISRRHIPSPSVLESYQAVAKWGHLNIFKNGEVQDLDPEVLGADITPRRTFTVGMLPGGTELWIGDGTTRTHIPDPVALAAIRGLARNGALSVYNDGETVIVPTLDALGQPEGN